MRKARTPIFESGVSKDLAAISHLRTYGVYYGILIAHYLPSPLNRYAVLASVISTLWVMLARRDVNIYKIYLLLLPAVGLYSEGSNPDWLLTRMFRVELVSVPIGVIPLTTPTALAVAVPFRLLFYGKQISRIIRGLWWPAFGLSMGGLMLAVESGSSSESGITVGVRTTLAFGAALITYRWNPLNKFHEEFRWVATASLLLFGLGALQNHWMFVTVALIPCLLLYFGKAMGSLLTVMLIAFLAFRQAEFSFTLAGVMALSILTCALAVPDRVGKIMQGRVFLSIAFALPALMTMYVLIQQPRDEYGDEKLELQNLAFKLYSDRKPIWDAAYEQIGESSLVMVQPGRPLYFRNMIRKEIDAWDWGAHNVFLEVFRQIGTLASTLIFAVVGWAFVKAGHATGDRQDRVVFWSLTSVYIVFGATGNTLAFAGTGMVYWFLLGALRSKVCCQSCFKKQQH